MTRVGLFAMPAYNVGTMVRWLATVFSLLFVFSAGLSASGLSMDPRSVKAGDTHLLFDLEGEDLAGELGQVDSDPDSPHDNLLGAEWSDWPDWSDRWLSARPSIQDPAFPPCCNTALRLPWPYLAALQRPPSHPA
jgi:hypothetical protein